MDGIITLILGFVLGVIVTLTLVYRATAYMLKHDNDFKSAMNQNDSTKEVSSKILEFFYGDEKE